ncbi:uncharacterized protein LOC18442457 [Amborella trichopoda]|uniref:Glycine-rich protein n=1 Tax=Amborella trichopoda TaxID=13333 RepID=U5CYI4_AMBTC|nr:uncharacterized protein LOC18442457 [Amborella trichopoda]ERN14202.1 hypothetical protein AMTR_s00033p00098490 [Amborella trichopoda]|eukprot:XP_006852735.1 uncharacterized protein LOC18442457 [Amborella trichopoda]
MGSNGIAIASAILLFSLCFQVKKADPNNLLQKNETTTEEEDQGFETEPDFDMKFLVLETSSQPDSKSPDSETGFGIGEGFPVVESTTKVGGVFGEEFVEGEGGQTIPRRFLKGGGHGGGRGGSGGGRGGGRGRERGAEVAEFFQL